MKTEPVILEATFNEKVCTYWLLSAAMVMTLTIIGIPLLLIWLPLGMMITRRYLERMECILTRKNLKVNKGIFVRVEKTIPLEKITDMGMVQGPIMRHFGIHQLTVETAGQSSQGALVSLTGINDVEDFRERVLSQRDYLQDKQSEESPEKPAASNTDASMMLNNIHKTLLRIEEQLKSR